jgi:hypothetical protein
LEAIRALTAKYGLYCSKFLADDWANISLTKTNPFEDAGLTAMSKGVADEAEEAPRIRRCKKAPSQEPFVCLLSIDSDIWCTREDSNF